MTGKQTAFKYFYARNGQNGLQAAKDAKYKGDDNTLSQRAYELVRNSKVKEAIDEEIAKVKAVSVANRQKRQEFWSAMMQDGQQPNSDRLRASELLGKSEADFTEKYQHTGAQGVSVPLEEQPAYEAAAQAFKLKIARNGPDEVVRPEQEEKAG